MDINRTIDSDVNLRSAIVARFASNMRADLDRVAGEIASGWRTPLEDALQQTLQPLLAQHAKDLDDLRTTHSAERNRLAERLAQSSRRLRQYESEAQWASALADTAQLAARRVLVFSVNGGKLRFQAARGVDVQSLPDVPLAEAAAFGAAVQSAEPAVALRTKQELSEAIAAQVGEDPAARFAVYPITTRQRVAALVYAEEPEAALLDLVVTIAGAALESHMAARASSNSLIGIVPASGAPFITRDEEERHSRALRFARVQVAEIRLYHSQAVKTGRADHDLYKALRSQIDEIRAVYQERYLKDASNMADYLHQEVLRTLANGNAELLGPDYPGPLD